MQVKGLGFLFSDFGFRVLGLGFRVSVLGLPENSVALGRLSERQARWEHAREEP